MAYFRKFLGMKSEDETPVPSKPPLTEKEISNAQMYFLRGGQTPSNQDIANYLKRNINDVNKFFNDVRQKRNERVLGVATTQPKSFFNPFFPLNQGNQGNQGNQESSNFPIYKNSGGRRTNKNKKNCKKLSRRRSNKKNRKSMKRK